MKSCGEDCTRTSFASVVLIIPPGSLFFLQYQLWLLLWQPWGVKGVMGRHVERLADISGGLTYLTASHFSLIRYFSLISFFSPLKTHIGYAQEYVASRQKTLMETNSCFLSINNPVDLLYRQCTNSCGYPELSPMFGKVLNGRRSPDCLLCAGFVATCKGKQCFQIVWGFKQVNTGLMSAALEIT